MVCGHLQDFFNTNGLQHGYIIVCPNVKPFEDEKSNRFFPGISLKTNNKKRSSPQFEGFFFRISFKTKKKGFYLIRRVFSKNFLLKPNKTNFHIEDQKRGFFRPMSRGLLLNISWPPKEAIGPRLGTPAL